MPSLPVFWTEWNVPGMREARDTMYVGPALANTVRECDGMVDMLSFWTFSDVFEEGGPIARPFVGMFGLRAKGGINKPSYYGYGLLHELGDRRIANQSQDTIVTKTANGGLAIAAWDLVDPGKSGTARSIHFVFAHVKPDARVTIQRVDEAHGNVLPQYRAMGSPSDPTAAQVKKLNQETALPPPTQMTLQNGALDVKLTPNELALIQVTGGR